MHKAMYVACSVATVYTRGMSRMTNPVRRSDMTHVISHKPRGGQRLLGQVILWAFLLGLACNVVTHLVLWLTG